MISLASPVAFLCHCFSFSLEFVTRFLQKSADRLAKTSTAMLSGPQGFAMDTKWRERERGVGSKRSSCSKWKHEIQSREKQRQDSRCGGCRCLDEAARSTSPVDRLCFPYRERQGKGHCRRVGVHARSTPVSCASDSLPRISLSLFPSLAYC